MNEIDTSKYREILRKKSNMNKDSKKTDKFFKNIIVRVLVVIVLFLLLSIFYKSSDYMKDKIIKYLYTDNISFTKINNIYNKYLGGVLPFKNRIDTEQVFNESLKYNNLSIYYDGVNLGVSEVYLVPALEEGMVVFIGEKENYGETIIIEDLNGIRTWYGNISNTSLKLYDYISQGSLIGEVNNNLYLVFSKEDKYLNYEEYLN